MIQAKGIVILDDGQEVKDAIIEVSVFNPKYAPAYAVAVCNVNKVEEPVPNPKDSPRAKYDPKTVLTPIGIIGGDMVWNIGDESANPTDKEMESIVLKGLKSKFPNAKFSTIK